MMSQPNRADNFTNPDYLQGMDIKDWVRAARRFRVGLTQEALAEALSCAKAAISHWESGRNIPSLQQAMAISAITGYPLLGPDGELFRAMTAMLKRHGFRYSHNTKGSHEAWVCGSTQIIVPFNLQSKMTANGIMKQAGINHKF